jgi:hypothetical protein
VAFGFVSAGTLFDNSSTSSAAIAVPAGTAANDLLIAHFGHSQGSPAPPNSEPSGWALIAETSEAPSGTNWAIYWKLAVSSEASDYTWGWSAAGRTGGLIVAFRDGFDTGDPIDVVSDTGYVVADSNLRAASMVVSAANSPLIFFGGYHTSGAGKNVTPPTNPATFSEHVDTWGGGGRKGFGISSVIWTGSGATGDMDATTDTIVTAGAKHAFAIALNPSGGAPAGATHPGWTGAGWW